MTELTRHDLAYCVTRMPREVREQMKRAGERLFLAGGFIRSVIASEKVNDVDLFTADAVSASDFASELAAQQPRPKLPYKTDNAFTVHTRRISVQYIHRWSFTRPEDAIESFDFTVAKAAIWWSEGDQWVGAGWQSICDEGFYADLAAKRLVYTSPQRNEDAGGSMLRVLKFYQRGYRIPLDSMGAVMARLCQGLRPGFMQYGVMEKDLAANFTALLREVDPQVDPDAEGHEDTIELPEAA